MFDSSIPIFLSVGMAVIWTNSQSSRLVEQVVAKIIQGLLRWNNDASSSSSLSISSTLVELSKKRLCIAEMRGWSILSSTSTWTFWTTRFIAFLGSWKSSDETFDNTSNVALIDGVSIKVWNPSSLSSNFWFWLLLTGLNCPAGFSMYTLLYPWKNNQIIEYQGCFQSNHVSFEDVLHLLFSMVMRGNLQPFWVFVLVHVSSSHFVSVPYQSLYPLPLLVMQWPDAPPYAECTYFAFFLTRQIPMTAEYLLMTFTRSNLPEFTNFLEISMSLEIAGDSKEGKTN